VSSGPTLLEVIYAEEDAKFFAACEAAIAKCEETPTGEFAGEITQADEASPLAL
jgi:hypothetical protein